MASATMIDSSKNPIYYTKADLKHCSKWKKYINKIHNLILEEIPNMCLVEKTNVCFKYASNDGNDSRKVMFECRYEGVQTRSKCSGVIIENGKKIFHITKKTPKKLYKSLTDFIDLQYANEFTVTSTSTPFPSYFPLAFSQKYIDTLKKGLTAFYDDYESEMDW